MPQPEPVLETPRLVLRVPDRADFDAWAALQADAEGMRYLGGAASATSAWKHLVEAIGSWHVLGFGWFSVERKTDHAWVGRVGPLRHAGWPGTEVGWSLARSAWGKGYATEAATAAMGWAFKTLGVAEIVHCIAPDNAPSQAVARRMGSIRRGRITLPPPYADRPTELWGQTRTMWLAHHAENAS